ncbi:MAG: hypothetical protein R3B53_01285 [Candidatus Paceibacterota bacterium]
MKVRDDTRKFLVVCLAYHCLNQVNKQMPRVLSCEAGSVQDVLRQCLDEVFFKDDGVPSPSEFRFGWEDSPHMKPPSAGTERYVWYGNDPQVFQDFVERHIQPYFAEEVIR